MSRWIDAGALIRKYIDTDIEKFSNSGLKIVLENLRQNILKAPSIDICFCKECMYWHKNRKEGDGMNVFDVCYDFQADDFCSYGCRKE